MKKKIMTVDDSLTIRRLVGLTLEGAGYEVCMAIDGEDALSKISAFSPDLIFCDVNMPKINGLEFVRTIKKTPEYSAYKYTPVVMLTTENADKMRLAGQEAGVHAWMVKPFLPERLLSVAEKILGVTVV
jgi:two-component system, chemotaxis family, chemotaxis protein CheY